METSEQHGSQDGEQASAEPHRVTRKELVTAVASSTIGTTIEWYDFFLYGTAAGLVFNQLYFPGEDPTVGRLLAYATFAIGFVARPVGGLIFGHLGDRIGRKKSLVTTMYIMGFATFLIGAVPTYEQIGLWAPVVLIVLRLAQGVAIGGEWGGAVLMSVEYAPRNRRGFFGSFPQIGVAFGLLLGTGVFTILTVSMSSEQFLTWGWRISFFISILLVIVGLYLRSKISETPAFRAAQENVEGLQKVVPLIELLKDRISRRHLLLGMGCRYAEGVSYNLLTVFLVSFATNEMGYSSTHVLISTLVGAAVLAIFVPIWGRVSDSVPRRLVFGVGAGLLALGVLPAILVLHSGSWLVLTVVLVVFLGIVHPLMYGPEAAFFAELFPAATRYSGISVVYQLSGIVAGGLTPIILTGLLDLGGVGPVAGYVAFTCVVTIISLAAVRSSDVASVSDDKDVSLR